MGLEQEHALADGGWQPGAVLRSRHDAAGTDTKGTPGAKRTPGEGHSLTGYCEATSETPGDWVRRVLRRLALIICAVPIATVALAEDLFNPPPLPTSGPGYVITLGAYGLITPKFEGSRHDELTARPMFGIRNPGDRVWLDLPNDGIEYEFIETDNFRAGAVGNFRFERQTDSLVRGYRRIRNIDISLEGGGFAEYWPAQWLRTRAEVRDSFVGANGVVADFSADFVAHPFNTRWTATAGPRLSIADQEFMESYYGVTPTQSNTSGLSVYHPKAGVRSLGAGSSLRYQWNDAWTTLGYIEYTHLGHIPGESPLIDERGSQDQVTVGLGAKYNFYFNPGW